MNLKEFLELNYISFVNLEDIKSKVDMKLYNMMIKWFIDDCIVRDEYGQECSVFVMNNMKFHCIGEVGCQGKNVKIWFEIEGVIENGIVVGKISEIEFEIKK